MIKVSPESRIMNLGQMIPVHVCTVVSVSRSQKKGLPFFFGFLLLNLVLNNCLNFQDSSSVSWSSWQEGKCMTGFFLCVLFHWIALFESRLGVEAQPAKLNVLKCLIFFASPAMLMRYKEQQINRRLQNENIDYISTDQISIYDTKPLLKECSFEI